MSEARTSHTVVVGRSRMATALARQEAATGPVVQVTGGEPEAVVAETGAAEARLVVVDLPEDAATLAFVAALLDRTGPGPHPQIVANLRDPSLGRAVDDNLFAAGITPRPRIVGTAALAAAHALAAARPYDLAYWRGQARVHAVVLGFSTLGRACFEDLVLSGLAGDLDKPRITIIDPAPDPVRKRLERDMPEIAVSADIAVLPFDPLTLTAADGPLAAAEAEAPLTLIVIALEDVSAAMAAMGAVARMQEADGQAVASVLVMTEGQRSTLDLARPRGRDRDLGRTWTVQGGIETDPDILGLIMDRADDLAERIHDTYRARFGGSGDGGRPWPELRETYRRANRRAADHLPLKLWTVGLREPGTAADPFTVDPHTFANVIQTCARGGTEDALVRRLSRIEHDRWCAERRLDGWRYGEIRDDARRIHPKLVPFDDPRFTDQDIEKDADQVRFLFGTVVTASDEGAVTPLVLGILSTPRPTPGIDVEAALQLCQREAWRPVVVLSSLLDAAECRLLSWLAAEFARTGRPWRLVVPEITRDNREIRLVAEPADIALVRGFLDRPSTRFAPIGRRLAPVDLWADPSAPDPHVEAIAAYVEERASAIVDGSEAAPPPAR